MKKDRSTIITISVLIAVLLIAGWYTFIRESSEKLSPQDTAGNVFLASELTLEDLEGRPVSLEQFRGKAVVVSSWASWCPSCMDELPNLSALSQLYNPDDVVVLAINRAETLTQIDAYKKEIGALPGVLLLKDDTDSFYRFIDGFTVPETVFYDADGSVVFHKRGPMTLDEMRLRTNEALR